MMGACDANKADFRETSSANARSDSTIDGNGGDELYWTTGDGSPSTVLFPRSMSTVILVN